MTAEQPQGSPQLLERRPNVLGRVEPLLGPGRAGLPGPVERATTATAEKIPTGIAGLDRVIDGFPKGGSMLLIGENGSGKTVFALHFANSACSRGLRTVFLTTSEKALRLRQEGKAFGWELGAHEEKGLLALVELAEIRASRIELSARRGIGSRKGNFTELFRYLPAGLDILIMDSLGGYASGLSQKEFRDGLAFFIQSLDRRGITALLLIDTAAPNDCKDLAILSVQGAIQLFKWDNPRTLQREKVMDIIKMGNVKTPVHFLTYEIDSGGFEVRSLEDVSFPD